MIICSICKKEIKDESTMFISLYWNAFCKECSIVKAPLTNIKIEGDEK